MRAFYLAYSEILQTVSEESGGARGTEILQTASGESDLLAISAKLPLPWSQYVKLLSLKNEAARRFYEAEALRGGWTVRQLERQSDPDAVLRADAALAEQAHDADEG